MMDGLAGAEVERRLHWFRLAREFGQEDDFRALLDDVRRQAIEDYKRSLGSGVPWSGEPATAESLMAFVNTPADQPRRLKSCVANWPDCYDGGYDPSCCRFPKQCSCETYSEGISDDLLEP